ncbi:MAG: hypothetical protein NT140_12030 [Deltaproteobacteria bacterium]|nr:hypothetical protein [Deltaproteobacteria bacterium]
MYIHFAFGAYKNDIQIQTNSVIDDVLQKKRLLLKANPEFIPVFQPHIHAKIFNDSRFIDTTVLNLPLEGFLSENDGLAELRKKYTDKPEI